MNLQSLGLSDAKPVSGGCIHRCYRAARDGVPVFLKTNQARYADAFAAEADGLAALRAAGCTAPEPLAQGALGSDAYLLMQFLELRSSGDFAAMGRMLARVHRAQGRQFGWHRDNYIGSTPQHNAWCDDWPTFWRERRLRPQLELARKNGYEIDADPALEVLHGHAPAPSLLHGDLWSGNAAFLSDGTPVLFDPAVYYGDREADLAMTALFGGFPGEFYAAYEEAWPLAPGHERRKHLYNLYHLLNHLNLFGGGYLRQVESTLNLLARACR
ncbi:MAG TPA: fructosamine kinase family protein [Burkholderiales bacterium]